MDMYHVDFEWAVKWNRLTLNVLGLWPRIYNNSYYKFWSDLRTIFFLFLFIFVGMIPGLHALVRTWDDMFATIDNLQFILPILTSVIKLIIIRRRKTDLALVLRMAADDWSNAKTDKELHVMTEHAQVARIITLFGYTLTVTAFGLIVILPCFNISIRYRTNVTDPGRLLPLQSHFIYDKDRSPYFEITFVVQSVMLLSAGVAYSGVDNLLGVMIFHLCGQMENLKERMIDMKQFQYFNDRLAFIVQCHTRLIKGFNIVENTFTLLLLELVLYFSTLFCLCGFLIITVITQGKEMAIMRLIYLVSAVVIVCGHMCVYCVVGEILVTRCEGIYNAAYNYNWYLLEPKVARSLIIIMIRTSKPLHITAGKIFPMTMSMFCNLMKTSAGYISVLLARQS